MTLIKTSMLSAIAVAIKMLTLLGLNKILAIYVGPAGYAALGQFQNAVQMITTLASGALNTGVTKYTAEYHADEGRQRAIWRTAGTISFVGSMVVAVTIIIFNRPLANWFLKDEGLGDVFVWFAATLVFFVFNTLLLAILNGKKEIRLFVIANISGSLFALTVTTVLAVQYGLFGALVALAIYQSLAFFVTLWICKKTIWFKLSYLFGSIDQKAARNLAKFTAMAITSAACVPVSHILIRNYIGQSFGWETAGYWEAIWRLSGAYLLFFTTTLSIYYLPRLSELTETSEIRREIIQGYKIIIPVAVACSSAIYLFRDLIIKLLFTSDFIPMREFFAWQMLGDVLKIGSWILSYLMLGKAMVKAFVATEVFFSLTFVVLVYHFTPVFGAQGVAMAYSAAYFLYWGVVGVFLFKSGDF